MAWPVLIACCRFPGKCALRISQPRFLASRFLPAAPVRRRAYPPAASSPAAPSTQGRRTVSGAMSSGVARRRARLKAQVLAWKRTFRARKHRTCAPSGGDWRGSCRTRSERYLATSAAHWRHSAPSGCGALWWRDSRQHLCDTRVMRKCYSKRTLPGVVMRRSSGRVSAMTPKATARPIPIRV